MINDIINNMTLEEKAAQMFFVRLPDNGAEDMVQKYRIGGYILFANDFDSLTSDGVKEKISSLQSASAIPLFIGADEEGGRVVRMSCNPALAPEPFMSQRLLYERGGISDVLENDRRKIDMLSEYGVNVNFAPVCDMSDNPEDYIYSRTLCGDGARAAECIAANVALYNEKNTGCVLKHFPGYGSNADTHKGVSVDNRTLDELRSNDLLPFKAGIDAGAPCVMLSHNIVSCVDANKPASLSKAWHTLLREELGFDGCIITDDLIMQAIVRFCDSGSAAVNAVLAGNDLLCCSDFANQYPAVLRAMSDGILTEERIDESVVRILKWKECLGLI